MLRTTLGVLSVGALAGLAACALPLVQRAMRTPTSSASGSGRVLLVYFSCAGENHYCSDRRTLDVGDTEVVVRVISDRIGCDVFRIEAADPYPTDDEQTVARNVREEQQDARPAITGTIPSLEDYDTIALGGPVWKVCAPMASALIDMPRGTCRSGSTAETVRPKTSVGLRLIDHAARCRCLRCRPGRAAGVV